MEDKPDDISKKEAAQVVPEPIGIRIVGETDPRTLTSEQFRNSPDLLFHGAAENFVFTRSFDYKKFENPGGFTIGAGFYATDSGEEARRFSQARSSTKQVVITVLPYQTRMFDFRAKDNQSVNAPVPNGIFQNYFNFTENKFGSKYVDYDPQADRDFIREHKPN